MIFRMGIFGATHGLRDNWPQKAPGENWLSYTLPKEDMQKT